MNSRMFKGAGIVAAILGVLLILVIFALLGRVDLIYMKDGRQVYRQDNVRYLSNIDDPNENMDEEFITEGEDVKFSYCIDGKCKDFNPEKPSSLKADIIKTVLTNLLTFKWGELDNDITLTAK